MKKILAYKAFDKDLKCRNYQFEVGKEYHEPIVKICQTGFHSCTNPYDVLNYYPLIDSRFCEVEVWGTIEKHSEDSKIASEFIFLKRELTQKEMNLVCINYLITECEKGESGDFSKQSQSGDYSQQSQSGSYSQQSQSGSSNQQSQSGSSSKQSQSGSSSKQSQSGYSSKQSQSGSSSQQSQSGDFSQQSQSGDYSQQSQSGDYSQQSQSGDSSQQLQSGSSSKQCSCGDNSDIIVEGINSVAAAIGRASRVKGIKGTWVTLAEYNDRNECICVKSRKIDGRRLKENVFYTLKDKKFVIV